jgi:hypothetical protein
MATNHLSSNSVFILASYVAAAHGTLPESALAARLQVLTSNSLGMVVLPSLTTACTELGLGLTAFVVKGSSATDLTLGSLWVRCTSVMLFL